MSERSRRIVTLALIGKAVTSDSLPDNLDDDADPFSTASSETEYIPSSVSSNTSSNQSEKGLVSPVLEKSEITPLQLEYSEQITIPQNQKQQDTNLTSAEYYEPFPFEYDNSFKGDYLINDVIIAKLVAYFQKGSSNNGPKKEADKRKTAVYNSPHLIANKYKKTECKFCESKIISKHFARHLERKHKEERQVRELLSLRPGSTEKKQLLLLLRNEGNLDDALRGKIIPRRCKIRDNINVKDYALCVHCKGYYKRLSLSRHVKTCFARKTDSKDTKVQRPLAESLIFSACQKKYGEILNKLSVKTEIFSKMQADDITTEAIQDILIAYFGENLLKKTKMKRSFYHISNKLRECAKFLIEMKKLGSYDNMISILKPENFDNALEAVKAISRYNNTTRSFGAASLALHFRTTLVALCDLATKLILRRKIPSFSQNIDQALKDLERFKNLVETQWATEIGSLALKDLNEKAATKPKLLPVTDDIIKLVKCVEKKAEEAYENLKSSKDMNVYRILSETVLVSTILHNRKRVGDVQYLEWESYKEQIKNTNTVLQTELAASLTENEKIMTQNYKRIVSIGKGSRPVTVLIPKKIQKYYTMLDKLRNETWFPSENTYFFTYPKSRHWIDGCSAIRKYATMCGAKHPELLTSNRLRKHIATVTQLLSLRENEIDQLAKFMGHTTKTHETFYKLPQDVYQIAKVSKILHIMEKGNAAQFKNKSLEEIEIDMDKIGSDLDEDQQEITDRGAINQERILANVNHDAGDTILKNLPVGINNDLITKQSDAATQNLREVEQTHQQISAAKQNNFESPENLAEINDSSRSMVSICTKKGVRERWTPIQKTIMRQYFKNQIKLKKALRKGECESFIDKYKSDFTGVGWVRVKTFVFNEYRLK